MTAAAHADRSATIGNSRRVRPAGDIGGAVFMQLAIAMLGAEGTRLGHIRRRDAPLPGVAGQFQDPASMSGTTIFSRPSGCCGRRTGCDYLRGTRVVYYSKPRAEFVTGDGPLDDAAITASFKGICEAASGCLFEIAQREVGTIFGDIKRGRRYVRLAREAVDAFWRP